MYCKHCNMEVVVKTEDCPLCKKKLVDDEVKNETYPSLRTYRKTRKLALKIFTFIFLVASIICGLVNYLTFTGTYWSFIVIASSFAALILFYYFFKPGFKMENYVFYTAIVIPGLLLILDYLTNNYNFSWSVTYTLPLILTGGLLLLDILAISSKKIFKNSILKLFVLILISILLIFLQIKIWTFILAISIAIISVFLFIIFYSDLIKEELKKRFHSK